MANLRQHRVKLGVALVAVAVLVIAFLTLSEYSVYFYTPAEAISQAEQLADRDIRVGGLVKAGSRDWQPETLALNFAVIDTEGNEIQVSYKGTPPDMFKESAGVVVEGRISPDGRTFRAKQLLVKHSEEYRVPSEQHAADPKLLEKSIFK